MADKAKKIEIISKDGSAPDPDEKVQSPDPDTTESVNGAESVLDDHDLPVITSESQAEEIDELAMLREELSATKDRLLRQAADFQNFRRRVQQERAADVKFGQSLVLQQFLDVFDDLRRSLEASEDVPEAEGENADNTHPALKEGVELVFKKFSDELKRFGVEPIEAEGKPFDEHEHEAIMQQPAPEGVEPGVVLTEVQKGYRMGDRVLRHTKVVVSI